MDCLGFIKKCQGTILEESNKQIDSFDPIFSNFKLVRNSRFVGCFVASNSPQCVVKLGKFIGPLRFADIKTI